MKSLQLYQLGEDAVADLQSSFDNLPHTNHKDGKYRLRRYSVIELRTSFWNAKEEAEITHLAHRDFNQSEELNKHQGGMVRSFEEIEDGVLQSEGMKKLCLLFKQANDLIDGQEVEIHQMRVKVLDLTVLMKTPVSPEGTHQDGFDHIAIVGINRHNLKGGALMVFENKEDPVPFVEKELSAGEMIVLNDKKLWHNAKDISALHTEEEAYGDWFIFCARR
jgi:hypothetical protein